MNLSENKVQFTWTINTFLQRDLLPSHPRTNHSACLIWHFFFTSCRFRQNVAMRNNYRAFRQSLPYTYTPRLSTDLDDRPLLYNYGVIGRGRGAPFLIHKQSLQRSGHRLAWNMRTQQSRRRMTKNISVIIVFSLYGSKARIQNSGTPSTTIVVLLGTAEEICHWEHVIRLRMTHITTRLSYVWITMYSCEKRRAVWRVPVAASVYINVYFSIYFRPQRSADDVDVCYSWEEQEVKSPWSGRQLQI